MGISETIIETILDRINVEQEDIDKATEILDMISFTKEDGRDVVVVKIGENVELKIYKWKNERPRFNFIAGFFYSQGWQIAFITI